ncbi:MAG TPA: type II secretion system protein GspD [Verrucomicrobiae bacterium]
MLSRPSNLKAAAAVLLVFSLTGCQHTVHRPTYSDPVTGTTEPAPAVAPSAKATPRVKYSPTYDKEIREIMDLAREDRWEEAQQKATDLLNKDPKDSIVTRVYSWVNQQAQQRRAQSLEDKIRSIDARNSVFSPTPKSLLKEQRDRGLPPRKDVRDAVDKIESSRWVPETYSKVVHEQAPLFDFESAKGKMAKVLEKDVTVHLDNVPLESILIYLSQNSGVNIVADKTLPALKQMLSVNLDKVKLSEFLRYVGRNYDLQFQVGDDLVWVTDGKDPKKLMEETRFYRLRKGFVLPAEFGASEVIKTTSMANNQVTGVTETQKINKFVNDLAPNMTSLEKTIKELWAGTNTTARYLIDYERNLVVARGTAEQLDTLEKIIKEFDQPIQQVLIEARFVTVSKPAFMQLGVLWETGRQSRPVPVPVDYTGLVTSQNVPTLGVGIQQVFTNVLGAADLSATITALEQTGESQTLSAPRLTVLNNRPATISDGNVQYYYEEYTVKTTAQQYYQASSFVPSGKPSKITAGSELEVLASISGDGKSIVLALHPRVNTNVELKRYATLTDFNQNGELQSTFDINLPQYRTQELATRMVVKSGDTVVMGGVLERQRSTFVESVPVLGDLPLIGALFRRRTEQDTPRYLLVFVTATIVKDTGEFLILDDQPPATSFLPSSETPGHEMPAAPAANPAPGGTNAIPTAVTTTNTAVPATASTPVAPSAAAVPAPAAPAPTNAPVMSPAATTNAAAPPK